MKSLLCSILLFNSKLIEEPLIYSRKKIFTMSKEKLGFKDQFLYITNCKINRKGLLGTQSRRVSSQRSVTMVSHVLPILICCLNKTLRFLPIA